MMLISLGLQMTVLVPNRKVVHGKVKRTDTTTDTNDENVIRTKNVEDVMKLFPNTQNRERVLFLSW